MMDRDEVLWLYVIFICDICDWTREKQQNTLISHSSLLCGLNKQTILQVSEMSSQLQNTAAS